MIIRVRNLSALNRGLFKTLLAKLLVWTEAALGKLKLSALIF
jgi:hypothetical protein